MKDMRARTSAIVMVAMCLGLPALARPQSPASPRGPAFDCSKASGEVETLICADEALGALDRQLDTVYKAAIAKARDDVPRSLRAEQRGWVSARNECWKAKDAANPVYLTESWMATGVGECVEGQYRIRIAELQVQFQLVPSAEPVFFACNNNPANEIVATFFQTEPRAARFERGDRTVIGYQVSTAAGAQYEGQNLTFSNTGDEATVMWLGESLTCRTR